MQYCAGGSVADICCEVLASRCRYPSNLAPSQADAGARAAWSIESLAYQPGVIWQVTSHELMRATW